jgi:hypothetical protein
MIKYTEPKERQLHHGEQAIKIPQLNRTIAVLAKQNEDKQRKVGEDVNNLNLCLSFLNNATTSDCEPLTCL